MVLIAKIEELGQKQCLPIAQASSHIPNASARSSLTITSSFSSGGGLFLSTLILPVCRQAGKLHTVFPSTLILTLKLKLTLTLTLKLPVPCLYPMKKANFFTENLLMLHIS